jgi:hypothetical protein
MEAPMKGVKTKLIGVVLVFVGVMNSMLSWRGGFALDDMPVLLLAGGVILYAVGAVRQGQGA